ncbi:MAG TPA: hypothetical protein PKH25_09190, partial [Syntrophales bacterium]|nr:hypothetical protein [Syntrophales bacterium]
ERPELRDEIQKSRFLVLRDLAFDEHFDEHVHASSLGFPARVFIIVSTGPNFNEKLFPDGAASQSC